MTEMFRPPVNRAMRVLDRDFFHRNFLISAARIYDSKNISNCRRKLEKSKDNLQLRQILPIRPDPSPDLAGRSVKCLLLKPEVKSDDESTWSSTIKELVAAKDISIVPFELKLDYDYWTAWEILAATLPEEVQDELPTGLSQVGHIAHMNLRDECLPYKNFIGQVILDKNPTSKTVINKVDTLGAENQYRVLDYEVLAGDDNMNVEQKESGCIFRFDYSKVFWNSRLQTEHRRLVDTFKTGEAVCDVMAGVGPFAIPAGKRGVFAFANDLNPDCFKYLKDGIKINKVANYVQPFSEDGHTFIPNSVKYLLHSDPVIEVTLRSTRTERDNSKQQGKPRTSNIQEVHRPRTFAHYVMNLPSTAIDFLPDFIGIYSNYEHLFEPETATKLPLIHVYCFAPPVKDVEKVEIDKLISQRISEKLDFQLELGSNDYSVFEVRDVAPNKSQYCATFRLPRDVAFLIR